MEGLGSLHSRCLSDCRGPQALMPALSAWFSLPQFPSPRMVSHTVLVVSSSDCCFDTVVVLHAAR